MNWVMEWLSPALVYATGWTLLHSLWQGALIAGLLWAGLRLTRQQSSSARYAMAYLALMGVALCSALTFSHYFQSLEQLDHWAVAYSETRGYSQPDNGWATLFGLFNHHMLKVVAAWAIGFSLLFCRYLSAWVYCQRLKGPLSEPATGHWQYRLSELGRRLGLNKHIELRLLRQLNVPCTIGHIKPVVLMPIGLLTRLTEEQLEAILLHELAHIRRHDYLFGLLQNFVRTFYFFNPATLWICRHIDRERENACDDIAVRACRDRLLYARSLERLTTTVRNGGHAMMALKNKQNLLPRIERLFETPRKPTNVLQGLITSAAGLVLALAITLQPATTQARENYDQIDSISDNEVANLIDYYIQTIYADGAGAKIVNDIDPAPDFKALKHSEKKAFANYLEDALWNRYYKDMTIGFEDAGNLNEAQLETLRQQMLLASVGHHLETLRNPQARSDTSRLFMPGHNTPVVRTQYEDGRIELSLPLPLIRETLDGSSNSIAKDWVGLRVFDEKLAISIKKRPGEPLDGQALLQDMKLQDRHNGSTTIESVQFFHNDSVEQVQIAINALKPDAITQLREGAGLMAVDATRHGTLEIAIDRRGQGRFLDSYLSIMPPKHGVNPQKEELNERIETLPEKVASKLYTPEELDRFMLGLELLDKSSDSQFGRKFQRINIQKDWIDELMALRNDPAAFQQRLDRAQHWIIEDHTWLTIKRPEADSSAVRFDFKVVDKPFHQALAQSQTICEGNRYPAGYDTVNASVSIYGFEQTCDSLHRIFRGLFQKQQT